MTSVALSDEKTDTTPEFKVIRERRRSALIPHSNEMGELMVCEQRSSKMGGGQIGTKGGQKNGPVGRHSSMGG